MGEQSAGEFVNARFDSILCCNLKGSQLLLWPDKCGRRRPQLGTTVWWLPSPRCSPRCWGRAVRANSGLAAELGGCHCPCKPMGSAD